MDSVEPCSPFSFFSFFLLVCESAKEENCGRKELSRAKSAGVNTHVYEGLNSLKSRRSMWELSDSLHRGERLGDSECRSRFQVWVSLSSDGLRVRY